MSQPWGTVAIVGVGLLGGSLALALRQRQLAARVVGVGRSAASLELARRAGIVEEVSTDLAAAVAECELVVLCTPVASIVPLAGQVAAACTDPTLLTDVGSTKASIAAALAGSLPRGARFLGSHPIAGSDKQGPLAASASLFEGRTTVLTPTDQTDPADLQRLSDFWQSVGAEVRIMSPADHDAAMALTSHLPHVVAAALAATLPAELLSLTGTGFADTTRVAAGGVELWQQILADNRVAVLAALEAFRTQFDQFQAALAAADDAALAAWLTQAKQARDALGS